MLKKFLKKIFKPIWLELFGRHIYMLRNEQLRTQRKLIMKDDIWRIDDFLFYVPNYPVDFVQSCIVDNDKFFEEDILLELDQYINNNSVILDIGANIGNHSLYWSKKRNARKIYCFEPIRDTFTILKKNIALNHLENIVFPVNVGLSDEKAMAKVKRFTYSDVGGTSITKDDTGDIQLEYLDNVEIAESQIDFVKIDVEGHEINVLNGAANTINKYKPDIFIESFSNNYITVDNILTAWGYRLKKSFVDDNYLYVYQGR